MRTLSFLILFAVVPVVWSQPAITGKSTAKLLNLTYAEPALALSAAFVDDDGSWSLDEGEAATLTISIANNGQGKAYEVKLSASGTLPNGITLDKREESAGLIPSGEKRSIAFPLRAGD
ncbi:MAG: hypothetical protein FJY65_12325, partial [Calditrichaeota bacterium]|nr:hypothetical protein [Calditrichota bacterium]